jgi:prepilin-type N-terminal cleavage/methylation domain-containing protein
MRFPPRRGMTLLEMMMVVAIISILAAVSASALGPAVGRYRQAAAAEAVAQLVALARLEARQQTRCYQVQVLSGGTPVAPGTPGDTVHVERRTSAECDSWPPLTATAPDTRLSDVRMPTGMEALVPSASSVPEFRPNGYTRNGLDTELQVGPAGAPTRRIAIRSFGPICAGSIVPPQACP